MASPAVTLDDKYTLESGRVYLTGIQALVRLPMVQRQRDVAAGLDAGCFISGYRGSPVGGYDQQLWRARSFLARNRIHFQPGVNEDLAATAVWGSQQTNLFEGATCDGVFSIWYAKGPGVDRSGDAIKHGNMAGSSPNGGVLLVAGDDHVAKSSTVPHQSEFAFMDANVPVLNPAGVQEILDFGLHGFALSRYSGCWIAFKTTPENMDSSASISVDPARLQIVLPPFDMPVGGLSIRWPDDWLEQETRLHHYKLPAVRAYARANRLDRIMLDSSRARLGIVTAGKSYLDVRQALDDLGIGEAEAEAIGLRLYKVGMPWPLEPEGLAECAAGLEELLIIEEKRPLIEQQVKDLLYNAPASARPRVVGKFDEAGRRLQDPDGPAAVPRQDPDGELLPARIARVIAERIGRFHEDAAIDRRIRALDEREAAVHHGGTGFARTPYFCSGCPHNTSTRVPDGSRAMAGIGCHFMSVWMDRNTETFPHGRRGRDLDRTGAVYRHAARLRQPG